MCTACKCRCDLVRVHRSMATIRMHVIYADKENGIYSKVLCLVSIMVSGMGWCWWVWISSLFFFVRWVSVVVLFPFLSLVHAFVWWNVVTFISQQVNFCFIISTDVLRCGFTQFIHFGNFHGMVQCGYFMYVFLHQITILQVEYEVIKGYDFFGFFRPYLSEGNPTFVDHIDIVLLYWFILLSGIVPQVKSHSLWVSMGLTVCCPSSPILFKIIIWHILDSPTVVYFKSLVTTPLKNWSHFLLITCMFHLTFQEEFTFLFPYHKLTI